MSRPCWIRTLHLKVPSKWWNRRKPLNVESKDSWMQGQGSIHPYIHTSIHPYIHPSQHEGNKRYICCVLAMCLTKFLRTDRVQICEEAPRFQAFSTNRDGLTLWGLGLKTMFNVGSLAHPEFCGPPCAFIAAGKCTKGATCGSGAALWCRPRLIVLVSSDGMPVERLVEHASGTC